MSDHEYTEKLLAYIVIINTATAALRKLAEPEYVSLPAPEHPMQPIEGVL